ncbi:GNAT family N-acetyltransferase [Paenibacillus oenotherae]|uniref:GNAT family N-acetyltransferase n=1 Tax=Paenibacillus oenotherae TaxID=1435645 RepID=A0ABS7D6N0_9BACL|nr:GNAT family protein [Paenibacillus oenotherae]MBW7475592.1 GNAT family N-acetyltransferase [Paenibacillus oenotherae]
MTVAPAPNSSRFSVVPLDSALAEQLSRWRYEPPFDFYNWSSWEVMQQLGLEFGDPDIRNRQYTAVLNEEGLFIGFAQFFSLLGVVRLGLGLRPDLCGLGLGLPFVQTIVGEALRRAPGDEIDLEVHVWNIRAIRTYQKAGFTITDTYERTAGTGGSIEVHCMSYLPTAY